MATLIALLQGLPTPALVGGGGIMTLIVAYLVFQLVKTVVKAVAITLVLGVLLGGGGLAVWKGAAAKQPRNAIDATTVPTDSPSPTKDAVGAGATR